MSKKKVINLNRFKKPIPPGQLKKWSEAFELMLRNNKEIAVTESVLWLMCSTVQLACRHPEFQGPNRDNVEKAARGIFELLTARYPGLKTLAELGWNPDFDL